MTGRPTFEDSKPSGECIDVFYETPFVNAGQCPPMRKLSETTGEEQVEDEQMEEERRKAEEKLEANRKKFRHVHPKARRTSAMMDMMMDMNYGMPAAGDGTTYDWDAVFRLQFSALVNCQIRKWLLRKNSDKKTCIQKHE